MTGNTLEQRAAGILSQALADLGYKPSLAFGGMIPAEAARAAVEAALRLSAGAGWVLVPREPTEAMFKAVRDGAKERFGLTTADETWALMISAAPRHEPGEVEGG